VISLHCFFDGPRKGISLDNLHIGLEVSISNLRDACINALSAWLLEREMFPLLFLLLSAGDFMVESLGDSVLDELRHQYFQILLRNNSHSHFPVDLKPSKIKNTKVRSLST